MNHVRFIPFTKYGVKYLPIAEMNAMFLFQRIDRSINQIANFIAG